MFTKSVCRIMNTMRTARRSLKYAKIIWSGSGRIERQGMMFTIRTRHRSSKICVVGRFGRTLRENLDMECSMYTTEKVKDPY